MTSMDNDRFYTTYKRGSDRATISSRYSQMAVNQCIVNEGTEDELLCQAYRETNLRKLFFYLLVISTLGIALLVFHWKPEWKVWIRGSKSDIELASHLVLRDKYEQNHVRVIKTLDPIDRSYLQNHNDELKEKSSVKSPNGKIPKQYIPLTSIKKYGLSETKYFEHKFNKYLWQHDTFVPLRGLDCNITVQQMQEMKNGLNVVEKPDLKSLFGLNSIAIKITPIVVLLFREILNPYYAFQLFAIIVWCADEYYSLPAVVLVLSIISISLSLYLTRKQNIMIHKMSSGSGNVRILAGDKLKVCDSQSLLPGDVIEIQDKVETMWCDCVLLSGNCVLSESMLTGESVPVLKTPVVCSDVNGKNELYDPSRHKQHTLYGGTKIVDVQRNWNNELPKALVIRTGFYTEKGKMIEAMLAPSPLDYKFYNDSLKFIFFMAIIGLMGSILTISFLSSLGAETSFIVKRVLDLITIVVPPGLPAALTVATIYAQRRLRHAEIFCISPPRIAISGKINCMCFDKTGTLTENDLKLWGVVPCKDNNNSSDTQILADENEPLFYDTVHSYEELPQCGRTGLECLNALASCHSLVTIDEQVTGDPVDLELFQATKWKLRKPTEMWSSECSCVVASKDNNLPQLGIVRVFQFNSVMQRMSVVTKCNQDNQALNVYVKGAPETIASLCNKSSVPSDFTNKLQFFTMQGYRVLALASKTLAESHKNVQDLERNEVESKLNFLGLAVLLNPLKPHTAETISTLKTANIRTVMATGDNLETALYVAKKCNMVRPSNKVVIVNAFDDPVTGEKKISWIVDSTRTEARNNNLLQTTKSTFDMFESEVSASYHFAMTGKTLSLLKEQKSSKLYYKVLACATVLARMKPDHKRHLVEGLQEINYTVGMCGDGANDCGALKAAHSGIAIAEAETSIVAPFTSMNKDISCCVKLIREGRAALVSSFGMIKYLCIYCFVQYLSLIILYTVNSYLSDMQFLFSDIGVTGIVTLFFGISGASKTLSKRQPHLSLVSPIMLTCLSLQIALLVLFQTISYVTLQQQTWHTKLVPNMTHPKENILSNENTVIFYTTSFQNMMLAFIFYEGLPHRLPLYKNVPYFVAFLLLSIWVLIMFFAPVPPIDSFFSLTQLSYQVGFKFILFGFYIGNLICAILVEKVLLQSESFRRTLKKLFGKCFSRIRKNQIKDNETPEPITYAKLQRDLHLDSSWPPLGQETVIQT